MSVHTLSVLVQNRPGVLARIAGMFARRGFNITSLAVGETKDSAVSRMTIVVNLDDAPLEQVTKQLHKLINVLRIVELVEPEKLERELALIKISVPPQRRGEVHELAKIFEARVVDVDNGSMVLEVCGPPDEVARMEKQLETYGVVEMARTGRIALGRGSSGLRPPKVRAIPITDARAS